MFINESVYWHGTGRISDSLNRLLHDVLGCTPAIILPIFFCKVKIFSLLPELPQKIIPGFIIERKYAQSIDFKSVNVTDMDHQPNGMTFVQHGSSSSGGYQFLN